MGHDIHNAHVAQRGDPHCAQRVADEVQEGRAEGSVVCIQYSVQYSQQSTVKYGR